MNWFPTDKKRFVVDATAGALVVLIAVFGYLTGQTQEVAANLLAKETPVTNAIGQHATIKTNHGTIEVELFTDKAPQTSANFIKLAESQFYNGVRFHRVIQGFMIQGGDPLSKDLAQRARWGTGGPGYQFADELKGDEKYLQGTLAMANAGPNTNGSQFFIVTASPGVPLPPAYTVFGKVTAGMDVALKIEKVATQPNDQPVEDVIIESITVR
jgi:cyclophilin family peptidyl-prolyl cis-trans isomerase